jgi:glutamate synthase (NADPH/NADH) small chain
VIGGGDTGSDCVGTSNRQGAKSVTQIEIMPKPPLARADSTPWPQWPLKLRTSSSHLEGCERMWNILTKRIETNDEGKVSKVHAVKVRWIPSTTGGRPTFEEIEGSEFVIEADYVFLAMGFTGPEAGSITTQFGLDLDARSNIKVDQEGRTSTPGVFAAGDAQSGASLVVRAIASGRKVAAGIHRYLTI